MNERRASAELRSDNLYTKGAGRCSISSETSPYMIERKKNYTKGALDKKIEAVSEANPDSHNTRGAGIMPT